MENQYESVQIDPVDRHAISVFIGKPSRLSANIPTSGRLAHRLRTFKY